MWAEDMNESQFGFRENRRTIDAIYVLFNKKSNKPGFAYFVDFAKAINHLLLWEKLYNMGLSVFYKAYYTKRQWLKLKLTQSFQIYFRSKTRL